MTVRKEHKAAASEPVPALEWVAAALGLILLVTLCAILLREVGAGNDRDVPMLSARVERVTATPAGFVADVVVENASRQTAAAVQVEGKLGDEEASATLDYVPGRSQARGGLMFKADPRSGALQVAVVGYELP
ncbi:hypothetical protein [Sphingomonas mesophila]|uniref:hypothetical protein n=1 Tax=Sphingomonas mesophila TaxID=2303576 RepID=UPI000E594C15|nr:hypothetical protein [Sphingomonas mesophila]